MGNTVIQRARARPCSRCVLRFQEPWEAVESVPVIFWGKCRHSDSWRYKRPIPTGPSALGTTRREQWPRGKIRALACMTGIFIVAHVIPGPAIVSALFHAGDIIRHQIVPPQRVALVRSRPTIRRCPGSRPFPRRCRMPSAAKVRRGCRPSGSVVRMSARWVSESHAAPRPCSASQAFASSTVFLLMVSASLSGANRDEQAFAIAREGHVARGMPAGAVRQARDNIWASPPALRSPL